MFNKISYVHALVYHERDAKEVPTLQEDIEASVATDQYRREIFNMGKSYAEVLMERGMEKGIEKGIETGELRSKRATLQRLLQVRFGKLPAAVRKTIEATTDTEQLDVWLERILSATSLDEMGITA